jgi:5-methylcytosine-specific restriction endonuclease McrA
VNDSLLQELLDAGTPPMLVVKVAAECDRLDAAKRPIRPAPSAPGVKRPGSKWRKSAFLRLSERDGSVCAKCGIPDKTIWRTMGIWSVEQWGRDPWECARYTRINPSSNLEVDHRLPLSEGGDNALDNLWLLCVDCHKAKTSAERSARLKKLFAEARS